jgi:hypothetical protein
MEYNFFLSKTASSNPVVIGDRWSKTEERARNVTNHIAASLGGLFKAYMASAIMQSGVLDR